LVTAHVLAMHDVPVTIQSGTRRIVLQTKAGRRYRLNGDLDIQSTPLN
jgi:hypothetical protein